MSLSMLATVIVAAGLLSLLSMPRYTRVLAWVEDVQRKKRRLVECRQERVALTDSLAYAAAELIEARERLQRSDAIATKYAVERLEGEQESLRRSLEAATVQESEALEALNLASQAAPQVSWRPRDRRIARRLTSAFVLYEPRARLSYLDE